MFNNRKQHVLSRRILLAREVAERSVDDTLRQLGPRAVEMSPAELRGYVRAYALPFVRDETAQLVSLEWSGEAFDELASTALEQATHLVVSQLKLHPVAPVPTPHVGFRKAA